MRSTTRRRPLIAAAAVVLIAVTSACTGGSDPTPTPTLEPAPSGAASDSGGAATPTPSDDDGEPVAGKCSVKEGDDKLPKEAPPVDGWESVSGVGVPTSEEYGPYVQEGELWTCYEHSPQGALFASAYIVWASGMVPGFASEWLPPGEVRTQMEESGETGELPSGGIPTLVGARFDSYSPERAVVDLAYQVATDEVTAVRSNRVILVWDEDRWRVDPSTFDQPTPEVDRELPGYIPWSSNAS